MNKTFLPGNYHFPLPADHNHLSFAQKQITIDDIWTNGVYRTKGVPGFRFMNDGRHYTSLRQNYLLKYDLTTGKSVIR
jgi:dipeptidyl-peptidase-4